MSDQATLALPQPADRRRSATWNGQAFDLGDRKVRVLAYETGASGWTDELTHFHEQTAGDDHFMDIASRSHAIGEVERSLTRRPSVILEVGVSSGYLVAELSRRLPGHIVIGSDYTLGTLERVAAGLPGVPLIRFDLTQCPLDDGFVDIAVLLNVLEHIDDHEAAVAQLFRIMRPGGIAIIEVPAGSSLFDVYDQALMHFRRYDMADLVRLVRGAGFHIERRSHLGFLLYPAFCATKRLNQLRFSPRRPADVQQVAARMIAATRKSGALGSLLMRAERVLRRHVYLPCGVRCLLTCRKPDPVSALRRKGT